MLQLATRLPAARKHVASELRENGLSRRRVTAADLRMLDAGLFRSGGDEYETEHGSHGVATLLRTHVSVSGEQISCEFPAKSGQLREAVMSDQLLARVVLSLKRSLKKMTKVDRDRLAIGDLVRVRDRDALERAVIRPLSSAA